MLEMRSYLSGTWESGTGAPQTVKNPATEVPLAEVRGVSTLGKAVMDARVVGGRNLRALSFEARGACLAAMAKLMHRERESLLALSVASGGNTRGDAKFDVDGAIAVLAEYADVAQELGTAPWIVESSENALMRGSKLRVQQVLSPRPGLAVHINAFNFPAWGLLGKLAVSVLAGMPVLTKPATSTVALASRIAELIVESGCLPEGAFGFVAGPAGDLLEHLGPQDVLAFTGSAATGTLIRTHHRVLEAGVRVNIEADSVNATVLGADVEPGSGLFDRFVRDCVVEITQKAGQKCTATRRIVVPQQRVEAVLEALAEGLRDIAARTGDPADSNVRMGPLATMGQLEDARTGLAALEQCTERVVGDPQRKAFVGVTPGTGYFMEPMLLRATPQAAVDPDASFHHREVFGPVATVVPCDGTAASVASVVAAGHGNLVGSVYSDDRQFVHDLARLMGPWLGRLVLVDEKHAGASLSPGAVLPTVNHGGPGRAGDGGELGGATGLRLYMQRTTLQAGAGTLARLVGRPSPQS